MYKEKVVKNTAIGGKSTRLISAGPWREYRHGILIELMQVDVDIQRDKFYTGFVINEERNAITLDNEQYIQGCCNQHQVTLSDLKTALLAFALEFPENG